MDTACPKNKFEPRDFGFEKTHATRPENDVGPMVKEMKWSRGVAATEWLAPTGADGTRAWIRSPRLPLCAEEPKPVDLYGLLVSFC